MSRIERHLVPVPQPYRNQPGGGPPRPYVMPQTPGYYGFHYVTPVPGRRARWNEFYLLSPTLHRAHATRFDEHRVLREFVLIQWRDGHWRAVYYTLYPDGSPQQLEWWENGRPAAFRATWDATGEVQVVATDSGDESPVVACTVSVSFSPAGINDPAPDRSTPFLYPPAARLYMLPKGQDSAIHAPDLPHYAFAGWSGDATGPLPQITVRPAGPIHLVAHYVWYSESNRRRNWRNTTLHTVLRNVLDRAEGTLSSYDLQSITSLDLSDTRMEDLDEVRLLQNLRRLDLSGTPVERIFPLSRHAAIEDVLTASPTADDPGLLNRVLLALHAGLAPPLEQLVLPGTPLRNEGESDYLPATEFTSAGTGVPEPPAALAIDLVDALVQFVTTYYPGQDPFLFNQNAFVSVGLHDGNPGPNGMPDAAEFRLLQAMLQSPQYDVWRDQAIPFSEVMRIWNANLTLSKRLLGNLAREEPFLLYVLCSYVTAGQWDEPKAIAAMLRDLKGLDIEPKLFEVGVGNVIRPDETFCSHGRYNRGLWYDVKRGRTIDRTVVDAYAEAVLRQMDR